MVNIGLVVRYATSPNYSYDIPIKDFLEGKGHTVTYISDSSSVNVISYDLIIVTNSCITYPHHTLNRCKTYGIPCIFINRRTEGYLFYGSYENDYTTRITLYNNHPVLEGLPVGSSVMMYSSNSYMYYGVDEQSQPVAYSGTSPKHYVIIPQVYNGIRHVFIGFGYALRFTDDAWRIIENSVNWTTEPSITLPKCEMEMVTVPPTHAPEGMNLHWVMRITNTGGDGKLFLKVKHIQPVGSLQEIFRGDVTEGQSTDVSYDTNMLGEDLSILFSWGHEE